ncbi:histone deacetylase family protein [Thermocoleostomius sinensis]|uniref:Histone deacetylase n=1 Tax=Thermocoleostomius sinensis A174 TaxID=2016057 RepID=A0A9E9CC03_9CYAN|nr:histone deacetylase [Thermocoleostomius sinensis]WAL61625.1 histone deacetylase [Thermocoleostomius sinensis A174]
MLPIIYSDKFLEHDTGAYHPERPSRLTAIIQALHAAPWAHQLDWQPPTPIDVAGDRLMLSIHSVHPPQYVEAVARLAQMGGGHIDPDTIVSEHSYDVALLAVSAWLDGVDRVIETGSPAFVLTRPPGHHALPSQGMGFCLFSNAAIAAHYALSHPSVKRVAILDWDVHHGNGTQAIVETHPNIAYCSLHEFPHYPGTGAATERGKFNNVLNFPLAAGSTLADYEPLFQEKVVPFLQAFRPDLLIVSAGYDANRADPLAHMALQPQDYGRFTDYCLHVTRQVVFGLEGGYDLKSLGQSVVATIGSCLSANSASPIR